MNDIQRKLFQLLKTVDYSCNKNKIDYVITDESVLFLEDLINCRENIYEIHIMVRARDFVPLKKALQDNSQGIYEVEDLTNNPKLAMNVIRYVDSTTTYVYGDNPVNYKCKGIAVIIHPAYGVNPSRTQRADDKFWYYLNCYEPYNADAITQKGSKAMKISQIRYKILGKKKMAESIFNRVHSDNKDDKRLYVWNWKGQFKRIDRKFLEKSSKLKIVDFEINVPSDIDTFIKQLYGKSLTTAKNTRRPSYNNYTIIVEPELPYRDFLSECKEHGMNFESVGDDIQEYSKWWSQEYRPREVRVNRQYQFVTMSKYRIDVWSDLHQKYEELENAANNNDIVALKSMMHGYLEAVEYFNSRNRGFYINKKLHRYFELICKADGRPEYADKIMSMVHPLHAGEELDDFMAAEFEKPENRAYKQ